MNLFAKIFQQNIVRSSEYSEFIRGLNGSSVEKYPSAIDFLNTNGDLIFTSEIDFLEDDPFTQTYIGHFIDGTKFRFIQPKEESLSNLKSQYECEGAFTIASIDPQGFAIHFLMVKQIGTPKQIESLGAKAQIYKLVEASILAFTWGIPDKLNEVLTKLIQLDPNLEITQTHPKFNQFSEILDKLK